MFDEIRNRLGFFRHCLVHKRSFARQRRWQDKHLARLARHASMHVPLWKEYFRTHGLDGDAIRTYKDLGKLPITSKRTYIGRMVEEYVDSSRLASTVWFVTSGTSGTPFRFLYSDKLMIPAYSDFGSLRFLWWRGYSLSHIPMVNMARIKIRSTSKEHRLFVAVEQFLSEPREALKSMADFSAEIISAYPSILLEMTRLVEKEPGITRPRPKYILSFGETLFPALRKHIEHVLKAEIYDRYGLEEIGPVGVECVKHNGFHINTESIIVEILDDDGNPVSDMTRGRIVVTDLLNYNMPFFRYDSGDRGQMTHEPCECGLRSPRLWVQGRYSAFLDFPHRRIHHLEFDGAMDSFMNQILQYQIAKLSDTEILARVIPGASFDEEIARRAMEKLRSLVGQAVTVGVQTVSKLPITKRGKSRIVVDQSVDIH